MKKVVVLGRGYLGQEFERQGFEVWGRDKFEISDDHVHAFTHQWETLKKYDTIINCIANSNTRFCEDPNNFDKVIHVNVSIPTALSEWCNDNNKKFVHISTGCLYDKESNLTLFGRNLYYNKETDFIAAHCKYTVSKWMAEIRCHKKDLIIRPRLLFSDIVNPKNLLCKLSKFNEFTCDNFDSITSTTTIVKAVHALLKNKQSGIFNVANEGFSTMHQIALKILNKQDAGRITAEDLRKREKLYLVNNVMDLTKLKKYYKPSNLEKELIRCYNNLHETSNL